MSEMVTPELSSQPRSNILSLARLIDFKFESAGRGAVSHWSDMGGPAQGLHLYRDPQEPVDTILERHKSPNGRLTTEITSCKEVRHGVFIDFTETHYRLGPDGRVLTETGKELGGFAKASLYVRIVRGHPI